MIVYGTRILKDISFSFDLPTVGQARYEITLSSEIPGTLEESLTLGFPFYQAHGRNVYLYSDRLLNGSEKGQPWCYVVKDVVRFAWFGGERTIFYEMGIEGTPDLLGFWLIHLLLPLYFTLEGMYDMLHGGAVEIDGRAVIFIAPSMGGKSTLTDYFIRKGHKLISDDKIPTFVENDSFMVSGSHPYHRPYRKFEELGYWVENFTKKFKPIHAFYELERIESNAKIRIKEVKGFTKFDAILPSYLYMFSWLKPQRLKYLSQMVIASGFLT